MEEAYEYNLSRYAAACSSALFCLYAFVFSRFFASEESANAITYILKYSDPSRFATERDLFKKALYSFSSISICARYASKMSLSFHPASSAPLKIASTESADKSICFGGSLNFSRNITTVLVPVAPKVLEPKAAIPRI